MSRRRRSRSIDSAPRSNELRASRERLAVAHDADRRRIERELHDGPQQHLVALAVNLQLARDLMDADPLAAKALLEDMGREVQLALEETGKLAHRIYPPLLEAGGLGAALRAAAVSAGVPTRIEVETETRYPPEIAGAVYFCCLEVLERAGERCASDDRRTGRRRRGPVRGRRAQRRGVRPRPWRTWATASWRWAAG